MGYGAATAEAAICPNPVAAAAAAAASCTTSTAEAAEDAAN